MIYGEHDIENTHRNKIFYNESNTLSLTEDQVVQVVAEGEGRLINADVYKLEPRKRELHAKGYDGTKSLKSDVIDLIIHYRFKVRSAEQTVEIFNDAVRGRENIHILKELQEKEAELARTQAEVTALKAKLEG